MSNLHKLLIRQLKKHKVNEESIPPELLNAISNTYTDFDNSEEKLNSIIEINDNELTLKNKQVNEILESLPGHVSWVDLELRYIGMNKNAETLLNQQKKYLIGKKINNELLPYLEVFSSSDKHHDQFEFSYKMNSQEHFFLVYLQRFFSGEKIIINQIDITDKVLLERQFATEEDRKLHNNRLILLGEMAAGVAHEVNNPMMIILNHAKLILKKYNEKNENYLDDDLDNRKRIEKIILMSNRVSKIVQSLKLLSRNSENDDFQLEYVSNMINPAIELSNENIKFHDITFKYEVHEEIQLPCKAGELTQVIYNCINNSIDAIKDLDTRWIQLDVLVHEKFCQIKITDSGKGIPMNIQEKLFYPFFTTKSVGSGTGLGLSISKKIIENHNGTIFIDNNSPNTCFVIDIRRSLE